MRNLLQKAPSLIFAALIATLWLFQPGPALASTQCGECKGGITFLELQYNGDVAAAVEVWTKGKKELLHSEVVGPGETFEFQGIGKDFKMGSEIEIYIGGVLNAPLHTSCSQPIYPGLHAGDFEVVAAESKDGGPLCECLPCKGGVTHMTLAYNGDEDAHIRVTKKGGKDEFFSGDVDAGDEFSFTGEGKDLKMGSEIEIYVNGLLHTTIHTSCSRPIFPGLIAGDFEVIDAISKDNGPICPITPPDEITGPCLPCKGGVTHLTLRSSTSGNIVVYRGKSARDDRILFQGFVNDGETFSFVGDKKDLKMGSEISVFVEGVHDTNIHTSCSQDIFVGSVFGSFVVEAGASKDGGPLCPEPVCLPCKGGAVELTLRFDSGSPDPQLVQVYRGKSARDDRLLFSGDIPDGGAFTFRGDQKDDKMGGDISVFVEGQKAADIHTSCSRGLEPGMVFGQFTVTDGFSKDGGRMCPIIAECPAGAITPSVAYSIDEEGGHFFVNVEVRAEAGESLQPVQIHTTSTGPQLLQVSPDPTSGDLAAGIANFRFRITSLVHDYTLRAETRDLRGCMCPVTTQIPVVTNRFAPLTVNVDIADPTGIHTADLFNLINLTHTETIGAIFDTEMTLVLRVVDASAQRIVWGVLAANECNAFVFDPDRGPPQQFFADDGIGRTADALEMPQQVELGQNYPNPFNPSTSISFGLPEASHARLVVYDLLGREVAVLVDGVLDAGRHQSTFDADHLAGGTYIYRLTAGEVTLTRRLVLVK